MVLQIPLAPCKMSSDVCDDETSAFVKHLIPTITNRLDKLYYTNDESKIAVLADSLKDMVAFTYFAPSDSYLSKRAVQEFCSTVFNTKAKPYDPFITKLVETEDSIKPSPSMVKLFQGLQQLIYDQSFIHDQISCSLACATFMKKVFCEILYQNRSDLEPLKILALLCAISGLDIPLLITSDSCCNNIFKITSKESSFNITAINHLLEACATSPIYFNLSSVPEEHLKPSDWLEGIVAALLDAKQTGNMKIWLQCFRSLLKISVPVVENNITIIIKSCLLNIDMEADDLKPEYCNFFTELISLESRLHQMPKFFVKLLLSLTECVNENLKGKCVSRGQIFPVILESLAFQVRGLPFGQTVELWKIFSETYTTFSNMSQMYIEGKGAVFFLAQIFSTFLLHAKLFDASIPPNVFEKFGDLIRHTTKELKKNIFVLFDSSIKVQPLKWSLLLLCRALGEIKLAYNDSHEETLNDNLSLRFSNHPLDCSLLLSFLPEQHTENFKLFLNSDDKTMSFLVYQLLIQKTKGLLHKKQLSVEEESHLQLSISSVLLHASEHISSIALWDLDLCTLNASNYGSAVWRMLLKFLPLTLNLMSFKDLNLLCGCFRDITLMNSPRSYNPDVVGLKSIIITALQSPYYHESKSFQTAFVTSVFKQDYFIHKKRSPDEMEDTETLLSVLTQLGSFRTKWLNLAESTPKSKQDDELNAMWLNIQVICNQLNERLQSHPVRTKLKKEVYNILQLIECLPVEFLLPGNQVRCIVGLSLLLFLVPESCGSMEAHKISEQISRVLIAIFDGVRSIWFFDFVTSGPYLREVITTIEKVSNGNHSIESMEWAKLLLDRVISLIIKNTGSLNAAVDYFFELTNNERVSEVSVLALFLMLKKLSQAFNRAHMHLHYKEVCDRLASLVCYGCVKLLKKYEGQSSDAVYSLLIQCYMEVIQILSSPACTIEGKRKDKCFALLPKIINTAAENISNTQVDQSVYFTFFARVYQCHKEISTYISQDFHGLVWSCVNAHFQQSHSSMTPALQCGPSRMNPLSFKEEEIELLQSIFSFQDKEDIVNLLDKLLEQMNCHDTAVLNVYLLQMNLNIIKEVINSASKNEESSLPPASFLNLISQLNSIVSQAENSEFNLVMIKIPVLKFFNVMVKLKRSCVPRQCLLNCLHSCVTINLQVLSKDLPLYVESFDAVWNVVYNLLTNHSVVVLSATAAFHSVVTNLLKSLVAAGTQEVVSTSSKDCQTQIQLCAQNMERLLTMLARHKIEFAKLVPYLIADYVDCVQHVTLESTIKTHLVGGINRLLDLCSEDAFKMLAVNISYSCRDIYSNIVKNYKQFRYRGQV